MQSADSLGRATARGLIAGSQARTFVLWHLNLSTVTLWSSFGFPDLIDPAHWLQSPSICSGPRTTQCVVSSQCFLLEFSSAECPSRLYHSSTSQVVPGRLAVKSADRGSSPTDSWKPELVAGHPSPLNLSPPLQGEPLALGRCLPSLSHWLLKRVVQRRKFLQT